MKLLFIIDSLRPGGAERQLVALISGLIARNYALELICLNKVDIGYEDEVNSLSVPITYYERTHRFDFGVIVRIVNHIQSHNIDMVHTFNNLGSLVGLVASKMSHRPVVCSAIRDSSDKNWMYRWSKYFLSAWSDVLVSNSKAGFNNRFRKWKDNYRVVYNGVNDSIPVSVKHELRVIERERLGLNINPHATWVGMVASLNDYKDHQTLIHAMEKLLSCLESVELFIIGDGPRRAELEKLAVSLKINRFVHFLGYRKDAVKLGGLMDVAVLLNPPEHQEGISNSLSEAMLQGVPVIASRGGGTDELLDYGAVGVLVKPSSPSETADAILQIATDPESASSIGIAGREHILNKFGMDRYVSDYIYIYHEVGLSR